MSKTHDHCTFGCTHNHTLAKDAAAVVARAAQYCEQHGLNLTPARAQILEILASSETPLGAYEMIDRLAAQGTARPAPTIIYRALEFLLANGFVHRIESKNAYLACDHAHHNHDVIVFLLCDTCGKAVESSGQSLAKGIATLAGEAGFSPRGQVIEIAGLCAACQKNP